MMDFCDTIEVRYGGLVTAESLKPKQLQQNNQVYMHSRANAVVPKLLSSRVTLYSL